MEINSGKNTEKQGKKEINMEHIRKTQGNKQGNDGELIRGINKKKKENGDKEKKEINGEINREMNREMNKEKIRK